MIYIKAITQKLTDFGGKILQNPVRFTRLHIDRYAIVKHLYFLYFSPQAVQGTNRSFCDIAFIKINLIK